MKELKYDSKKGYWISDKRMSFELSKEIENVEIFAKSLIKFLEFFKEDIPLKIKTVYPLFVNKVLTKDGAYFKRGYIIIEIDESSLISKLNPWHSKIHGDETIVIDYNRGDRHFTSYQEAKSEYVGMRYTWKLSEEAIIQFRKLLEKFAAGCWLNLDKLILGDRK